MRRAENRKFADLGRQRNRARNARSRSVNRVDNFFHRLVEQAVIIAFKFNSDFLIHGLPQHLGNNARTNRTAAFADANRSSFSMAIRRNQLYRNCNVISGMTISTPSGSWATPVTSVVLK